jgi:S1-C subfamily serine protease
MRCGRTGFQAAILIACLIASIQDAPAQSPQQIQAECLRAKSPAEKVFNCTRAIQSATDRRALERLYLRRGNAFVELGRHQEAIVDFTDLIKLAPRVAGYYDNRQTSFRELGMLNAALLDANTAVQIAPNYAFVFRSRAFTYEEMKQFGAAVIDLNTALHIDPTNAGLIIQRARNIAKNGGPKHAIRDLTQVIDKEPSNAAALKERGFAHLLDDNVSAARGDLTLAASLDPLDKDTRAALAALDAAKPPASSSPPAPPPAAPKSTSSSGSAFRIGTGQFVTNHHVVDGCTTLKIDGNSGARVVASDPTRDLALVSIANDRGEVASIRTTRILLNETVTAAGFPLDGAFTGIAITNGSISRLSGLRGDTGEVQISAPVQPGNSGGPLLDVAGNVIGVVSSKLNALKLAVASGDIPQNVNFAINGAALRAFLDAKSVNYIEVSNERELTGVQIAARASAFTVLIECRQ